MASTANTTQELDDIINLDDIVELTEIVSEQPAKNTKESSEDDFSLDDLLSQLADDEDDKDHVDLVDALSKKSAEFNSSLESEKEKVSTENNSQKNISLDDIDDISFEDDLDALLGNDTKKPSKAPDTDSLDLDAELSALLDLGDDEQNKEEEIDLDDLDSLLDVSPSKDKAAETKEQSPLAELADAPASSDSSDTLEDLDDLDALLSDKENTANKASSSDDLDSLNGLDELDALFSEISEDDKANIHSSKDVQDEQEEPQTKALSPEEEEEANYLELLDSLDFETQEHDKYLNAGKESEEGEEEQVSAQEEELILDKEESDNPSSDLDTLDIDSLGLDELDELDELDGLGELDNVTEKALTPENTEKITNEQEIELAEEELLPQEDDLSIDDLLSGLESQSETIALDSKQEDSFDSTLEEISESTNELDGLLEASPADALEDTIAEEVAQTEEVQTEQEEQELAPSLDTHKQNVQKAVEKEIQSVKNFTNATQVPTEVPEKMPEKLPEKMPQEAPEEIYEQAPQEKQAPDLTYYQAQLDMLFSSFQSLNDEVKELRSTQVESNKEELIQAQSQASTHIVHTAELDEDLKSELHEIKSEIHSLKDEAVKLKELAESISLATSEVMKMQASPQVQEAPSTPTLSQVSKEEVEAIRQGLEEVSAKLEKISHDILAYEEKCAENKEELNSKIALLATQIEDLPKQSTPLLDTKEESKESSEVENARFQEIQAQIAKLDSTLITHENVRKLQEDFTRTEEAIQLKINNFIMELVEKFDSFEKTQINPFAEDKEQEEVVEVAAPVFDINSIDMSQLDAKIAQAAAQIIREELLALLAEEEQPEQVVEEQAEDLLDFDDEELSFDEQVPSQETFPEVLTEELSEELNDTSVNEDILSNNFEDIEESQNISQEDFLAEDDSLHELNTVESVDEEALEQNFIETNIDKVQAETEESLPAEDIISDEDMFEAQLLSENSDESLIQNEENSLDIDFEEILEQEIEQNVPDMELDAKADEFSLPDSLDESDEVLAETEAESLQIEDTDLFDEILSSNTQENKAKESDMLSADDILAEFDIDLPK